MKEIINILLPIHSEEQKTAFIKAANEEPFKIFNPRNTKTSGKDFNCIEFPNYTGFDTHRRKAAFELLAIYFQVVGYYTAQEEKLK